MGSLEAMAKGSEARYLSDTQNLKIAQVRVLPAACRWCVAGGLPVACWCVGCA
jgi:hypothetical protein